MTSATAPVGAGIAQPIQNLTDDYDNPMPGVTVQNTGSLPVGNPVPPPENVGIAPTGLVGTNLTTGLNNQNQQNYQNWMNNNPGLAKTTDTDMQGAWLNGMKPGWQYQYAQPTHPAFSDKSIYHGQNGQLGGSWTHDNEGRPIGFTPTQQNIQNAGGWPGLQQHFANHYPQTLLTNPGQPGQRPQSTAIAGNFTGVAGANNPMNTAANQVANGLVLN
ncbi:hypothetical protein A4F89_06680 [Polynucleobacter asymbioticus]|uniref:Uncharacterized protein n=2 Tax=Polynucleobacter asymbioticus TaxID=576611 RepID=A0AAC9ISK8_9BURK|nr:hypothetical protein A4F89_06680 [Polynucleobacter asymbioticus]APC01336.1 hypothetical protein AOC25_06780 [Polynucleobacter asymbioticus]